MTLLAASFIVSRVLYYLLGIRYDTWDNTNPMQLIFPELIVKDFWRSLFYFHSQPPFFNFCYGVVLKLFPDQHDIRLDCIITETGEM